MAHSIISGGTNGRPKRATPAPEISIEHYLRLLLHRKWVVIGTFVLVGSIVFVGTAMLPDVYTSDTVIMVDPQKVPEAYVKSTVTGDVRNRLGTLSQQILSTTRLQKIIDTLNLYPQERQKLPREDVITRMRADIKVNVVSDFGGSQDLQAFRITYSGKEPRRVAQVTNQLASLFIDENLKAREQQATGTTDFLHSQLNEARKTLEAQEAKLKEFKLKHIGEMPEQQTATLQVLGQIQSQLQVESEALARAEQQKSYLQSMIAQSTSVIDVDGMDARPAGASKAAATAVNGAQSAVLTKKARLEGLKARGYTDLHPDIRKLTSEIEQEEAKAEPAGDAAPPADSSPAAEAEVKRPALRMPRTSNPVLESQLQQVDTEIAKHKEEQQRLHKLAAGYEAKLESIPVREQEVTHLVRDYEMSKAHYGQLLDKQLSAETATQLEVLQKGEKFKVLDAAQPAQRPSQPNRPLLNAAGAIAGLVLGVLLALFTEVLGASITAPEQITDAIGLPVLEVIPTIHTHADREVRRKRIRWAAVSGGAAAIVACAIFLYRYSGRLY